MGDNDISCDSLGDFGNDNFALDFCNSTSIKSICLSSCQLLACEELDEEGQSKSDIFYTVTVRFFTFFLLAGFAATVDTDLFFENFKDKGVYVGLCCQFLLMPVLGFVTVIIFHEELDVFIAIMIILVTSCPGGAYSNWFCSMFNADLSLSVAMTTTSTFLALLMLPLNAFVYLLLYQGITQGEAEEANDVISEIPYRDLFLTLATVLAGVVSGLTFGYFATHKLRRYANIVGNVSGVLLQLLALFASGTSCAPPWEQSFYVYLATLIPLATGMTLTFALTSYFKLPRPQRMAIIIEAGYQNIGIAAAVALSLGSKGRAAVVVSILYGLFQAVLFTSFCIASVHRGWSLTPPRTKVFPLLFDDYQDFIAVHHHYSDWRKHHPKVAGNFSEKEKRRMRIRLGYEVSEISEVENKPIDPNGSGTSLEKA